MPTLYERLASDIKDAMKQKDVKRLDTLRLLSAEITNFEKQNPSKNILDDANILVILQKEHKKRMEGYTFYSSKGLDGPATKEFEEAQIIGAYLPKFLEETEVVSFTENFFSERNNEVTVKNTGEFMAALTAHAKANDAILDKKLAAGAFTKILNSKDNGK